MSTSRRWLSYQDLKERGYPSEVSIWRWVRDGKFPPPAKPGGPKGRNYWADDVIAAHEAELLTKATGAA
jgi:predicted DNA-binding transcriptional regulator AlpA